MCMGDESAEVDLSSQIRWAMVKLQRAPPSGEPMREPIVVLA